MRTGHGLATDADWLWTVHGHGHGLAMDLNLDVLGGHGAATARLFCGHIILRWLRGRAYLGIKHDKNLIASAVE